MKWTDVNDEEGQDAYLAYLESEGAINELSFDEDGELLIRFNFERLYEIDPQFAEAANKEVVSEMKEHANNLVDRGLLLVSFEEIDNRLEPVYGATPEGEDALSRYFSDSANDNWDSMLEEFIKKS